MSSSLRRVFLAFMLCASVIGTAASLPPQLEALIASASGSPSASLVSDCAQEWWPVLSGAEVVPLHASFEVHYIFPRFSETGRERAAQQCGVTLPEGEIRLTNHFDLWQHPPDSVKFQSDTYLARTVTWCKGNECTHLFPREMMYAKWERESEDFVPWDLFSCAVQKVCSAGKLGDLVLLDKGLDDDTGVFDIVIHHKGPMSAATDVAPIVRLWIDRETAQPKKARFFGGEIDLEVHWVLLDKSGPLSDKVFELPENLGRELDIDSDEDMKTLLTLQMGKAFPDPWEPKDASHFWGSLQFLASGIVYGEIADECDLVAGTRSGGGGGGSEYSIEYNNSGISIEILQGEPWRNVKEILSNVVDGAFLSASSER